MHGSKSDSDGGGLMGSIAARGGVLTEVGDVLFEDPKRSRKNDAMLTSNPRKKYRM
jgi:hypothetical protein